MVQQISCGSMDRKAKHEMQVEITLRKEESHLLI